MFKMCTYKLFVIVFNENIFLAFAMTGQSGFHFSAAVVSLMATE